MTRINLESEFVMNDPLSMERAINMPAYIASSELIVKDLESMSDWYQSVIGLIELSRSEDQVVLGVGTMELLLLTENQNASIAALNVPGLYHNAFLVPSRAALVRWFAHAVELGTTFSGSSDHLVSEAVYLDDPEGNGIEVYRDRSRSEWKVDSNGTLKVGSFRMNLEALASKGLGQEWTGMEPGTSLGHIHLKASSYEEVNSFVQDLLGFDLMLHMSNAWFYSTGGYHHHISANEWHTKGQPARNDSMTGLKSYTFKFNDRSMFDLVTSRLSDNRYEYTIDGDAVVVRGPSGVDVRLV